MSAAAASKRVTSPYGRATNIAPSNPLTIMRACSRTGSMARVPTSRPGPR